MGTKKDTIDLTKIALEIADAGYPVFPTNGKKPVWSNDALGLAKTEGGFKIATVDKAEIEKLFNHRRAAEVSVPMGEASGLLCLDVDTYKDPTLIDWIKRNAWLHHTLTHQSVRGGYHFFFKYDPEKHANLGTTLRASVDIKGRGGFVVWVGTGKYKVVDDSEPAELPDEVLEEYAKIRSSTGESVSFNDATDEDLKGSIQDASEIYNCLLTLSWRMTHYQTNDDGKPYKAEEQIQKLRDIMDKSVAKDPRHPRHHDWRDRLTSIESMVYNAYGKTPASEVSEEVVDNLSSVGGGGYIDSMMEHITQGLAQTRHEIEPQAQPSAVITSDDDIEELSFTTLNANKIPPVDWLIPRMLPFGLIASLAGASNVGKTRWLAAFAACVMAGRTELIGLPEMDAPESVLWVANEEATDDIRRRIKAAMLHYNLQEADTGKRIYVIGKNRGGVELVISNARSKQIPEEHKKNVDSLIKAINDREVKMLLLDPYITLSTGGNENDSDTAKMLTKAFSRIADETGCAILNAHHCSKEAIKEAYAGSANAWRGSSAIYTGLDCGFTLSPYTSEKEHKKKKGENSEYTGDDWIALHTAKVKEGKRLPPVFYELVSQKMHEGEGYDIGVCRLATEEEAQASEGAVSADRRLELVDCILENMSDGSYPFAQVHRACKEDIRWVSKAEGFPNHAKLSLCAVLGKGATTTGNGTLEVRYDDPHDESRATEVYVKKL